MKRCIIFRLRQPKLVSTVNHVRKATGSCPEPLARMRNTEQHIHGRVGARASEFRWSNCFAITPICQFARDYGKRSRRGQFILRKIANGQAPRGSRAWLVEVGRVCACAPKAQLRTAGFRNNNGESIKERSQFCQCCGDRTHRQLDGPNRGQNRGETVWSVSSVVEHS